MAHQAVALRLAASDLVNAEERVGNYRYRLCEALAAEVDEKPTQPRTRELGVDHVVPPPRLDLLGPYAPALVIPNLGLRAKF